MKDFIINMLSDSSTISHKRTISFLSFICLIVILIFDLIGIKVSEYISFIFAGLSGFSSTLTVGDKYLNKFKDDASITT